MTYLRISQPGNSDAHNISTMSGEMPLRDILCSPVILSSSSFSLSTTCLNDRVSTFSAEGWSVTMAGSVSGENRCCDLSNEEQGIGRLVAAWCVGFCREMFLLWSTKGGVAFKFNLGLEPKGLLTIRRELVEFGGRWWWRMVKWAFKGTCSQWSTSVNGIICKSG